MRLPDRTLHGLYSRIASFRFSKEGRKMLRGVPLACGVAILADNAMLFVPLVPNVAYIDSVLFFILTWIYLTWCYEP